MANTVACYCPVWCGLYFKQNGCGLALGGDVSSSLDDHSGALTPRRPSLPVMLKLLKLNVLHEHARSNTEVMPPNIILRRILVAN